MTKIENGKRNYSKAVLTALGALMVGESLITVARAVKGGKIELEVAEKITEPGRAQSAVSLLNSEDERFQQAGARRAFVNGTIADILKQFGLDFSKLKEGEVVDVIKLNPTFADGRKLKIQVTEYTESQIEKLFEQAEENGTNSDKWSYLLDNASTRAKRAGKDGNYIVTKEGKEKIFAVNNCVAGEPSHRFIANTEQLAPSEEEVAELAKVAVAAKKTVTA